MGLSYGFGIGPLVGKIITEIRMFFFNWFVQKKLILDKRKVCIMSNNKKENHLERATTAYAAVTSGFQGWYRRTLSQRHGEVQ